MKIIGKPRNVKLTIRDRAQVDKPVLEFRLVQETPILQYEIHNLAGANLNDILDFLRGKAREGGSFKPFQLSLNGMLYRFDNDLEVGFFCLGFQSAWDIIDDLDDRWNAPCKAAFEYMAFKYPASLLSLLSSGRLEPADLTFVAEIVGRLDDHDRVRAVLVPLLSHTAAVVREGTIYGLTRHIDASVRQALEHLADNDPSAAVRTAALDALDEA